MSHTEPPRTNRFTHRHRWAHGLRLGVAVVLISGASVSAVVFSERSSRNTGHAVSRPVAFVPFETTTTEPPTTTTEPTTTTTAEPPAQAPLGERVTATTTAPPAPPPPASPPAGLAGELAALSGKQWNTYLAGIASNWA